MSDADCPGRRERKKQATRRAIRDVALRLALEKGVEHLTVEEISEVADIAPRTFFNYFPSKEDALVGADAEAAADLKEAARARPADEPPLQTLHAVLREYTLSRMARGGDREKALARQRLIKENPSLLPRQLADLAATERALAEVMAERTGTTPDHDLRPALLGALGVTVCRVAMRRWSTDETRTPEELIDHAFELVRCEL